MNKCDGDHCLPRCEDPECWQDEEEISRNEGLQDIADRGCDTWEEYRGER